MGLENLNSSVQNDEIYNMGLEWSYEQIDPEKFKAQTQEEKKVFLEGYMAGLEMQKQNTIIDSEKEEIKMSM